VPLASRWLQLLLLEAFSTRLRAWLEQQRCHSQRPALVASTPSVAGSCPANEAQIAQTS
jgi:hypothetical protein